MFTFGAFSHVPFLTIAVSRPLSLRPDPLPILGCNSLSLDDDKCINSVLVCRVAFHYHFLSLDLFVGNGLSVPSRSSCVLFLEQKRDERDSYCFMKMWTINLMVLLNQRMKMKGLNSCSTFGMK